MHDRAKRPHQGRFQGASLKGGKVRKMPAMSPAWGLTSSSSGSGCGSKPRAELLKGGGALQPPGFVNAIARAAQPT